MVGKLLCRHAELIRRRMGGLLRRLFDRRRYPFSRVAMYQAIEEQLRTLGVGGLVLRLGGTRSYPQKRQWFVAGTRHILMNVDPAASPEVMMDANSLGFLSDAFDCVVADQLLEHVPNPERVLNEAYRVLRPGGVVLVAVPFLVQIHARPDDYWRFSEAGLEVLLKRTRFEEVSTGSWGHPEAVAKYIRCSWRGVRSKRALKRLLDQEPDERFPLHCWALARKPQWQST